MNLSLWDGLIKYFVYNFRQKTSSVIKKVEILGMKKQSPLLISEKIIRLILQKILHQTSIMFIISNF